MRIATLAVKDWMVGLREKVATYIQLLKFRLTLIVSLSAAFGYAVASGESFSWLFMSLITLGGFFVTGASNILNQMFEKEYDFLMRRTHKRPIPQGKISIQEACVYACVLFITGVALIGFYFNLPAALLSIIGLLLYAFVYTPMKRQTPFAVFVGAIPGALPPLIGWVSVTGTLDQAGLILFAFQFFWQFPHFWAIAWLMHEDYQNANFQLLPTSSGKSQDSTRLMVIYTLMLIPMVLFPISLGMVGMPGACILLGLGIGFATPAWILHKSQADKHAKWLLLSSFLYLPFMQLTFILA